MPIACLVVPALALTCELAGRPQLHDHPVVLSDDAGLRVAELTDPAARRNVRPGQTLREAAALCPQITILAPHPARYRRVAATLRDAMAGISPIVEQPEPGAVFADLRGLHLLYPRPGDVERAILQAAPPVAARPPGHRRGALHGRRRRAQRRARRRAACAQLARAPPSWPA